MIRTSLKLLLLSSLVGCTNLIYQPSRNEYFKPTSRSVGEPENIRFSSHEGPQLHGWFFPAQGRGEAKATIVQFHGNAENMTSHFMSLIWVTKRGYNLFTFDYRGYGKSEGSPYPSGVHLDALAALKEASKRAGGKEKALILYGQSLGGAILLRALQDYPHSNQVRNVVLEGSFLSYKKIAQDVLSQTWITWPVQWMAHLLVSDRYSAKKAVTKIAEIPILVVHGRDDPIISLRHGQELFAKAKDPKCYWEIEARSHINLMNIHKGVHRDPMTKFFSKGLCPNSSQQTNG